MTRYRYMPFSSGSRFTALRVGLLSALLLGSLVWVSSLQVRCDPATATVSIQIVGVYTTNSTGHNMTTFKRGQTVIVWVTVRNLGSDLDLPPLGPITWVEVTDPRSAPFTVQFHIGVLPGGGRITRAGFNVRLDYGPGIVDIPTGTYRASGFVSDKMISQGGSFFAPQASATFEVSL